MAEIDPVFSPTVVMSPVTAIVPAGDGTVLVGESVGNRRLLRLGRTGAIEPAFQSVLETGANGGVTKIELLDDGRILVSGGFTRAGGEPRPGFARLLANGSLDRDFNPQLGADRPHQFAVSPDGSVYVLTHSGDTLKLLPSGMRDMTFNPKSSGEGLVGVDVAGRLISHTRIKAPTTFDWFRDLQRYLPNGELDSGYAIRLVNNLDFQLVGNRYYASLAGIGMLGASRRFVRLNESGIEDRTYLSPPTTDNYDWMSWKGLYRKDGALWEMRVMGRTTTVQLFGPTGALAKSLPAPSLDFGSLTPLAVAEDGSCFALLRRPESSANPRLVRIAETQPPPARIGNFSVRAWKGDLPVIAGVVTPAASQALVRAVGSGLSPFGITDGLSDPKLELRQGGSLLAANDNWDPALASRFAAGGAFFLPEGSRDAALEHRLPGPGSFTCHANAAGGGPGELLIEVYDIGSTRNGFINASGLVQVEPNRPAILGFTIEGNTGSTATLLIRAVGPALATFGVTNPLLDPRITIYRNGVQIAENDDWTDAPFEGPKIEQAQARSGAFSFPYASKDAAAVQTLVPGSYTAIVVGLGGSAGTALLEVYRVPPTPDTGF